MFDEFRRRKDARAQQVTMAEAGVPDALREQYLELKHEFAELIAHATLDACLEQGILDLPVDMQLSVRDCSLLVSELAGTDAPICAQLSLAELILRYDAELLRVASVAVDYRGCMRLELTPSGSGYVATWRPASAV